MRVTGGEEAGGSDPAPGRNKIENSATMQPVEVLFHSGRYCLSSGNEGYHPKVRRSDRIKAVKERFMLP